MGYESQLSEHGQRCTCLYWWNEWRSDTIQRLLSSLVDPGVGVMGVGGDLRLVEPEADLSIGGLDGVGAVNDVAADVDAKVTADGAGLGVLRLGGTEHLAAGEDGVVTLPDHGADGAGSHVLDEASEEALAGKVGVVLLHVGAAGGGELHGAKLEALLLEARDDLTNEASLDAVGLDHDESSLSVSLSHRVYLYVRKELNSNC
mmetsp:Transcript_22436/g.27633  ORF Transcript_22436/g.27633 Transcript_22436/m.27633 type:complete len:203 (+) Transcript_22436:79-687(+)